MLKRNNKIKIIDDPDKKKDIFEEPSHKHKFPSIKVDNRRVLEVPGDHNETIRYAVEDFIHRSKEAIQRHGRFVVSLSGGSTPKAMYNLLCTPHYSKQVHWPDVYLLFGDERFVAPTDAQSNYHMVMEAGFKHLPIHESHILRFQTELNDPEKIAQDYEAKLTPFLKGEGVDLMMLGLGDDGHCASLFPDTAALDESTRLVVANSVPQKNTTRFTVTYPFIQTSRSIVFYVLGDKKAHILNEVLTNEKNASNYPAHKVGTPTTSALYLADEKAASLVLKNLKK